MKYHEISSISFVNNNNNKRLLKKPLQWTMIESTRRHVALDGNSKFYGKES
jgi:hypothetical protein